MFEPSYTFTIPSFYDDTVLDCRIYHPSSVIDGTHLERRGAIIAHPYALLGGCQDDPTVLSVAECLVDANLIVGTFSFRGAYGGHGKTSWTGKPEQADYMSFVGLMVYYLQLLDFKRISDTLTPIPSNSPEEEIGTPERPKLVTGISTTRTDVSLLLGGYSYGSLILSQLPPLQNILQRFATSLPGTAMLEVKLRARSLADQTSAALWTLQNPMSPRGRQALEPHSPKLARARRSPVVIGGEEIDASERRASREGRRSVDIVRKSGDLPRRIRKHMNRHSSSNGGKGATGAQVQTLSLQTRETPRVTVSYLMISPVLPPISYALCVPKMSGEAKDTRTLSENRSLAVFGSSDMFTSSRRLQSWAEKLVNESAGRFQWDQIVGAGHFWREAGVMPALKERIRDWVRDQPP